MDRTRDDNDDSRFIFWIFLVVLVLLIIWFIVTRGTGNATDNSSGEPQRFFFEAPSPPNQGPTEPCDAVEGLYMSYSPEYFDQNRLAIIDIDTLVATDIGQMDGYYYSLAVNPITGDLFGAYGFTGLIARISQEDATTIDSIPEAPFSIRNIDFDSTGQMWGIDEVNNTLVQIDYDTGTITDVVQGAYTIESNAWSFAIVEDEGYITSGTGADRDIFRLSLSPPYTQTLIGVHNMPQFNGIGYGFFNYCDNGENKLINMVGFESPPDAPFVFYDIDKNTGVVTPNTTLQIDVSNLPQQEDLTPWYLYGTQCPSCN